MRLCFENAGWKISTKFLYISRWIGDCDFFVNDANLGVFGPLADSNGRVERQFDFAAT